MTDPDTVATYEAIAEEYREQNRDRSVVRHLVERFLTAVDDATADSGDTPRVLDVGCGPGWESATFTAAGHDVVGVDVTPAFLHLAREEVADAALARMDMRTLGFRDDCFDGLWVCASFLHVARDDAPATLAEFHRVLRPGGVLLLSVQSGTGERAGGLYDDDSRRFTLYQPDELEAMVEKAGFTVESVGLDGERWIQLLARG